jgi:hypothetical protein
MRTRWSPLNGATNSWTCWQRTPTTPGGAIALIDCFLEHEEENFDGVFGSRLLALLARLRGFLQSAA